MSRFKNLWQIAKDASSQAADKSSQLANRLKSHVEDHKDEWLDSASEYAEQVKNATTEYMEESGKTAQKQAKGLYVNTLYSKDKLKDLENRVESQGAMYRELLRNKPLGDTIFIGGESLGSLLSATSVPEEIENAYAAAYPDVSAETSFLDKVRELDGEDKITGLLSGVKGKLFEQQYVQHLNSDVLPEGYLASLASSANQAGWDIQITGPNQEVVQLLQAKATDSVWYVQEALERYPAIDVVTTDEVYAHLVMAGVSENISNSGFSEIDLSEQVESAAGAADIDFDFAPPVLTLAFIAFTSYRDESLTLYEKAKSAGDRSGKTYFSYLIGGGIAAITNTWWLGVLGSVTSRYMSDEGLRKVQLVDTLNKAYRNNQAIIDRMKCGERGLAT